MNGNWTIRLIIIAALVWVAVIGTYLYWAETIAKASAQ